jgi:hypothetical protein
MVSSEGSLDLDFPSDAYHSSWIATLVFGVPICAMLIGIDARIFGLDRPTEVSAQVVGAGVVAALVVGALLFFLIRLRQTRPARVTWDAQGITEWDGDRARTTIAWSTARRFILNLMVQYQRHGVNVGAAQKQGVVVQFTGERKHITLVAGKRAPRWVARRRSAVANLGPLLVATESLPGGGALEVDERGHKRHDSRHWRLWGILSFLGHGAAIVGLAIIWLPAFHTSDKQGGAFLTLVGSFFLLLRAIRPFSEWISLGGDPGGRGGVMLELGARLLEIAAILSPLILIALGSGSFDSL